MRGYLFREEGKGFFGEVAFKLRFGVFVGRLGVYGFVGRGAGVEFGEL